MSPAPSPSLRSLRIACYVVIGLLYLASVPWYRDADAPLVLWFGLPDWVAVALLCYVGVAVVNGVAWLATDVPDELNEWDERDGPERGNERGRGRGVVE